MVHEDAGVLVRAGAQAPGLQRCFLLSHFFHVEGAHLVSSLASLLSSLLLGGVQMGLLGAWGEYMGQLSSTGFLSVKDQNECRTPAASGLSVTPTSSQAPSLATSVSEPATPCDGGEAHLALGWGWDGPRSHIQQLSLY